MKTKGIVYAITAFGLNEGDRCYISYVIDERGTVRYCATKTPVKPDRYNGRITEPDGEGIVLARPDDGGYLWAIERL